MVITSFVALHGGHLEVTVLEYLYRVLLYLLAIGGIGVLVHRLSRVVDAVRSSTEHGREETGS